MAQWLVERGFPRVAVLTGGLDAWRSAGLPLENFTAAAAAGTSDGSGAEAPVAMPGAFLPSLASRYASAGALPARRMLATVFVDIAGSTRWLVRHPPETVLAVVQRFMRLVTEVALAYGGDVKDFEGDGALLYFESVPRPPRRRSPSGTPSGTAAARPPAAWRRSRPGSASPPARS